jgi:hypothetical protein
MGSIYLSNLDMTKSNLELDYGVPGDQVSELQEYPDPQVRECLG